MIKLTPKYRTAKLKLTRAQEEGSLTFGTGGASLKLALAAVIQGAPGPAGPEGPVGPQGPSGDGTSGGDPGDFTLIFDNNLI